MYVNRNHPLLPGQPTRGHSPQKTNYLSFNGHQLIATQLEVWLCEPFAIHTGLLTVLIFCRVLYQEPQLQCVCEWGTLSCPLFCSSPPQLPALVIFRSNLPCCPCSLSGRKVTWISSFRPETSMVTFFLYYDQLWVSVLTIIHGHMKLKMVESCTDPWL